MEQEKPKQFTLTFTRESVVNVVLGAELVLLLVFGWQIYGIKQMLETGGVVRAQGSDSANNLGPIAKDLNAPDNTNLAGAPAGKVEITIKPTDHIRGNKDAAVTIVEYSDFECPFCEQVFPTVKQLMDTYGDKVRLVYRHFPLSFHAQAQKAAEASECASEQGKFWEFHDLVFGEQSKINGGVTQLKAWAKQLGLNQSKFDSCLDSGSKADIVKNDLLDGNKMGVTGTPGFFVDGNPIVGAQPYAVFQQAVDAALAS